MVKKSFLILTTICEKDGGSIERRDDQYENKEKTLRSLNKLIWWYQEAGGALSIVLHRSDGVILHEWNRAEGDITGRTKRTRSHVEIDFEPEW